MQKLTRDQLKVLFDDVKHFRIAEDFDEVEFVDLTYYSFFDQTDFVFYTVYEFDGVLTGIKWNISRPSAKPLSLGLCDICRKHRKRDEIISIYAQTKVLPKNVNYRSRGFQICFDYLLCNEGGADEERINYIYQEILNN
jgi:hypothetical protein